VNGSAHQRARELILLRDVEGVGNRDAAWLESHLTVCEECARFGGQLEDTTRALRSIPVTAPISLVGATQARVRQRAAELRDHEAKVFLIGISFCLGLLWSAGSAFVGWKVSGWLAEKIQVSPWIVATGLVVFWLAPAIAIAVGLLAHHPLANHGRPDWLGASIKEELQ